MKKQWLWIGMIGLMAHAGTSYAAFSNSQVTTINYLSTYVQYGSGDVIFRLANPTGDCYGYWLTKSDAGFQATMAMLLAAYQAKTPVAITAYNDQIWAGSGNAYCKLYDIEYRG